MLIAAPLTSVDQRSVSGRGHRRHHLEMPDLDVHESDSSIPAKE
jgi:hypothetical protein